MKYREAYFHNQNSKIFFFHGSKNSQMQEIIWKPIFKQKDQIVFFMKAKLHKCKKYLEAYSKPQKARNRSMDQQKN